MQQEKEKTKTRPGKKDDSDQPIEGSQPTGKPSEKGEDLLDEAEKAKKEIEEAREKVRQRLRQNEDDAKQVREWHQVTHGQ